MRNLPHYVFCPYADNKGEGGNRGLIATESGGLSSLRTTTATSSSLVTNRPSMKVRA